MAVSVHAGTMRSERSEDQYQCKDRNTAQKLLYFLKCVSQISHNAVLGQREVGLSGGKHKVVLT